MLAKIKKIIPANLLSQYHKMLALLANAAYGRPSEKMIVIGVTGTNGKSTTVSLIAKVLEEAGHKVGATSTAIFKIAAKEWLNDKKMTMLGRFQLQKLLREMVRVGCRYAVIETSSQGIDQYRHLGINYDVCVFTNLTPEHIEAHGGFANYKKAKLKLFRKLENEKIKELGKKEIEKAIVANGDDEHEADFLDFEVGKKIVFGLNEHDLENPLTHSACRPAGCRLLVAENIVLKPSGTSFSVNGTIFDTKLFGRFNIYNCLAAIAVASSQGIGLEICQAALKKVAGVPGRMEFIETGLADAPAFAKTTAGDDAMAGKKGFKVLVDYAYEPESVKQIYQTVADHGLIEPGGRLIHVLGSCGGGRDVSRRSVLGALAAERADITIITNEDPYDDDPQLIIDQVAAGALEKGKILDQNLFKIGDRRDAIRKALNLAKEGDLVLLTGKGCEQAICVSNGRKIPWDEREIARDELKKLI